MRISPLLKTITARMPEYNKKIQQMREQIITNSILIGQIPSIEINMKDDEVGQVQTNLRVKAYLERLSEIGLQETAIDPAGNAVGMIKGHSEGNDCIVVAAHMDTVYDFDQEINFTVDSNIISGAGITDNSISLGVILSLPEILEHLGISCNSDVLLLGLAKSLGEHNLSGIREFLQHWNTPIKGGIILEGAELGRLNYFSRAMMRINISCAIPVVSGWENKYGNNAIIILNDIMNKILEIHLPQRPHTQIIIGKVRGGIKHGDLALTASIGLEIESTADTMVQEVYARITDLVDNVAHESLVDIAIDTLANVQAARLEYTHPLVQAGFSCLKALNVKPIVESSESELSIFLNNNISAITIGMSHGENYHTEDAQISIDPLFTGITQLVGLIEAIDKGVIDE